MKWLRERPERWEELDLVDKKGRWKDGARVMKDEDEEMVEPRKGALFDDEEEREDEEDEEEEEDAQSPVQGQVKVPLPAPIPTATATEHPPTPGKGVAASSRGLRR